MRNKITGALIAVVIAGLLILLSSGLYTVTEVQFAVVTQFGEPVRTVTEAGLYWKTPLVQTANIIERRIIAWDGDPRDIITQDKKNIFVDTWARWRVVDPQKFYENLGGFIDRGQKKLDDIVDSAVRNVVAKGKLNELVRTSNRELQYEEEVEAVVESQRVKPDKVEMGREKIEQRILELAGAGMKENLGIELIEVRIKRVNYIEKVRPSIYARMNSERERISKRFESEAREQEEIILGDMAKELAAIEGEALKRVAEIRGDADAKAIRIYADAIGQAQEFYEFVRTLEAYEKTFDSGTLLILSTDSHFLRLLKEDPKLNVP